MKTVYFLSTLAIFIILFSVFSSGNVSACSYHAYQQCSGSYLYWYDSCGNQQDWQYCPNGCYNGYCAYSNYNNYNYNNYNYGNCTYHAYKNCVGNNIYWYDSCANQQDLYYSCGSGQTCQYGQCAAYVQPPIVYNQPQSNYVAYHRTACNGNNVSWYDSLGVVSGLYKNCSDNNSCTTDTCSADKCSNTLKCDGSTCAMGSADYNKFCQTAPVPSAPVAAPQNTKALSVSFFAKQDASSTQWQKSVQVGPNYTVYFMISVINNSAVQVDNVNVSANIPTEISSLGNSQLNGVPVSGDIVSGINIGSLAPSTSKSITFEGKTQTISAAAGKQATATSNVSGGPNGYPQSDTISINLIAGQAAGAAVSAAPAASGFWGFLKRWYLWILVGLVLIFLFVVVFRRLSSNV